MVRLVEPNLPDLEFIALNMRPADKAEIYGILPHDNPFLLARQTADLCRGGAFGVVARRERPVAVMGFAERLPGVFDAFAYGTNEFRRVSMCLTRFALGHMKPALLDAGAHRLQADSRFDHTDAHRWLRLLGFRQESVMKSYGKNGADYIRFVALKEMF